MTYQLKSCFRSLQGEGAQAGRVAVFARFTGCNLWSGQEKDRESATCRFCDTDFLGVDGPLGGRFPTATSLASHLERVWSDGIERDTSRFVVFTGGEPLLQLDAALVQACRDLGFEVGVETNGTLNCPQGLSWICVSPKAGTSLVQRSGDELKLVHPQKDLDPQRFEELDFRFFSLQPLDGPQRDRNTRRCVDYCLSHPRWRLSVQTHKWLGIP